MNLIKPKKLQPGDKIRIIATSGNVDIEKILNSKLYFENKGYIVELGKNINKQLNYLAGTDEERLNDLHEAFADKKTSAIICARGGYGASRLIKNIDYKLLQDNPKIFCGYSDITILNAMFLKKSKLITFSGPMAQSDFANSEIDKLTEESFFNSICSTKPLEIKPYTEKIYRKGNCEGILFGGNLSTLVTLCGQDFIPDCNFIFFCEDLNEPTYKIDRYFTQLMNIETFRKNIAGIILGDFLNIDNKIWFDNLIMEISKELNIPTVGNFPISHSRSKVTIPYGGVAKLENNILKIGNFIEV